MYMGGFQQQEGVKGVIRNGGREESKEEMTGK